VADNGKAGRPNQRRRTRKDLLQAASRLMKQGRQPSLEEIAEEALVSRATAYRYFPSVEALLLEASLDVAIPEADDLFPAQASGDPVSRLECVDAALHDIILANEAALRAALEPARSQFKPGDLETLTRALALIIGTEAMVVSKDVLQLNDADTRKVKRWAIRALVEAARKPGSGR